MHAAVINNDIRLPESLRISPDYSVNQKLYNRRLIIAHKWHKYNKIISNNTNNTFTAA